MSAMKMDFICKDSPEKEARGAPDVAVDADAGSSPVKTTTPNAAKLSALLNSSHDSDVDMDTEPADEEQAVQQQRKPSGVATASQRLNVSEANSKARSSPSAKRTAAVAADEAPANFTEDEDISSEKNGGVSDNEDSEDEQVEYAAWQDVDLNPAVDLVSKVVRESLEAGKTYNKSITAKTTQLITGCDSVLLELKNLSDARDSSRKKRSKQGGQDASCDCAIALGMLPLINKDAVATATAAATSPQESARDAAASSAPAGKQPKVDAIAEDHTDRVLLKVEASVERLRELAEMIQATSMQGEANLISKVTLPSDTIKSLDAAIQAGAASATAAAIAQERGRTSSAFGRLYTPVQVQKLQEWYYSYPRPLTDELTLMRTILNYRPYANPFQVNGLTVAHIRDWFKRRRHRERVRFIKLAVEAGRDAGAAEEEIDLRLEQRIEHLRRTVDPNELVKEVDRVRAESPLYDSMTAAFASSNNVKAYAAASRTMPSISDAQAAQTSGGGGISGSRSKRPRTQESELDNVVVVKSGSRVEVAALQSRIRSQLSAARTATSTNSLQQVIDILRSMEITPEVRIQTGVVADLKKILKIYKKPTLLRKATIALLERLGMNRRAVHDDEYVEEAVQPAAPKSEEPLNDSATAELLPPPPPSSPPRDTEDVDMQAPPPPPANPPPPPVSRRGKREKGKRPMKFSVGQVMALEGWFQQKYKPSQTEMEAFLRELNAPPLRDEKQTIDVNMTQLRRWFNKRRCLRRPPFALMTPQEAAEYSPAKGKAFATEGAEDAGGDDDGDVNDSDDDDSNDDSSDDDDDDDSSDDDDDDQ